jgi:LysR family glycine cleavage system transcriptional activator
MDSTRVPLTAVRAFAAAARHRSLTRAAAELGVTAGAVGHQVRQLERRLGVRLLRRAGNSLVLTDAAQRALPELERGFRALDTGLATLAAEAQPRVLTLAADPSFAALWLAPHLDAVRAALAPTDVRVVNPVPLEELEARGVDLAISYRAVRGAGLASRILFDEPVVPACAPALAAELRDPDAPEALAGLSLLHIDRAMGDDVYPTWADWFAAAGLARPDLDRGPRFGLSVMAAQAAIAGQGAVLASRLLLDPDLEAGRLVALAGRGPRLGVTRRLVWPTAGPNARAAGAAADVLLTERSGDARGES